MVNGAINLLGAIGQFIYARPLLESKNWVFWVLFVMRCFEIVGKIYWDFAEDGGLFSGGTGAREFKSRQTKWQYGHFCPRPSFLPLHWLILHCIHSFVFRLAWIPEVLFSSTPFY